MVDESKCPACGKREVRPRYIAPTPSSSRRPVLPAIAQLWGCPIYFHHLPSTRPSEEPLLTIPSKTHRLPPYDDRSSTRRTSGATSARRAGTSSTNAASRPRSNGPKMPAPWVPTSTRTAAGSSPPRAAGSPSA